jgi:transcriptional regulator with XRE-family HTH domain
LASRTFSPTRFRAIREAGGFTRIAVAFVAGRTEQSIWLWERGRVVPSVATLEAVANYFDCDVTDFFDEVESHV